MWRACLSLLSCLCCLQVCENFVTQQCVNTRGADVCVKEQMRAMLAAEQHPASSLGLKVGLGVGIPGERASFVVYLGSCPPARRITGGILGGQEGPLRPLSLPPSTYLHTHTPHQHSIGSVQEVPDQCREAGVPW
jgi:hypothetical protein